jgi:hypothetical protein
MTALTTTNNDGATLLAIIQQAATQPDFDVAKMQQLMELKRDWDRDRGAEAFSTALTNFQAKCPVIGKNRTATITSQKGSYKYQFAGYEDVMKHVKPLLDENKIAVSFSTKATDKGILATCTLRVGVHSEECTLEVPIPSMNVNDTQKYGAALSYAKRYCLCAALNIVVGDEDDDASTLEPVKTITEEQVAQIEDWIFTTDSDRARFLKAFSIERISDLPATKYQNAIDAFKKKRGGK